MHDDKVRFERYKKIILGLILKHLPASTVYLFGSRARGVHQSGADIDIALDNKEPLSMGVMAAIQEEIEATVMPLTVDLVDLCSADDLLKNEIKKEGILWKK